MKVAFAGTPVFAARALEAIVAAGFPVPVVLTQPDRPAGRGMRLQPSAVKTFALAHGLSVLQPATLKGDDARAPIVAIPVDVMVVAAYGLILPPALLSWPTHGCLNIHASLLPRWRGAAPIQRAVCAGDTTTGITIMQMDAGLDTGPTIDRVEVGVGPRDTAGSLHDRLAEAGARTVVEVLRRLARDGSLTAVPQPETGVCYAAKVERADTEIDWKRPAVELDRQIRSLSPAPGAMTLLAGEPLKIWEAMPAGVPVGEPGSVLATGASGIVVGCGEGSLRVLSLQKAGGRRLSASAFLAGHALATGERFGRAG